MLKQFNPNTKKMKTAEQILDKNIPHLDIVPMPHEDEIYLSMREYAEQALSAYRSKILNMPTDERNNDFFLMNIEFDQFLP